MSEEFKKFRTLVDLTDLSVEGEVVANVPAESVVALDPESDDVKQLLSDGLIEEVVDPVVTQEWLDAHPDSALQIGDPIPAEGDATAKKDDDAKRDDVQEEAKAPAEPVKKYRGQVLISDGMRTVNDKEYHFIRIADGSTYDLTDEEYENEVITENV